MTARALFVFDRENWCSVFSGPEQACAALEIRLWTEGARVEMAATDDHDETQLRERLVAFATRQQIKVSSDDLIETANAILREDWNSRWPKRPRWLASRLHGNAPPKL